MEGPIIGLYDPGDLEERMVVADAGVHVRVDHQWRYIRFFDIADVKSDTDKKQGDTIELRLLDGEVLRFYTSGHTGRFRDLYEISRFLQRAATLRDRLRVLTNQ